MITEQRIAASSNVPPLGALVDKARHLVQMIAPLSVAQLALRVALAVPFWRSGILKWDGFLKLSDTAVTLFTDEFMLHLPGGPYHFPAPGVMAFMSGCGEITFPVLLVLGLGTRFAALGLLVMTAIVELAVPDGWPLHITWAAMALALMAHGGGRVSLDYLICAWRGRT
ncbi:putative membrane protein, DoxD domain [Bradyrhizobium oligotrophicum S58]|uniref:Putative membrane protein, DoxD domain n=1 Tax=Bradyrhizobium oligotrophicum S58 TaxID=1245469 RepID=M4ZVR2_9BRAD|nr:DoxX family protein [Bradyrhizobium oligotrophicum]BAM90430.1 putative membrane protein, DoxD domain [Bradyrhizobium oligotrophicum S58]